MLKATYSHIFKYLERQTGYLLILLVYPTTPHTSIKQVHNYTHIIWWARWFQEETNRFPRTKAGHQNGHQITSKPNCYTTGLEAFRAWVKGSHDRTMHKLHKLVIFICKRSGSKKKKICMKTNILFSLRLLNECILSLSKESVVSFT